jgi:bla regulator protein blaR1
MGRKLAVMCMAAALASLSAAAQSFEVVSVKSSDPATPGTQVGLAPGGIFQARGITLKDLTQQAYEVLDFQISGGPGWINTERYEIEGKGNGPAVSEDDLIKMTDEQRNQFRQQMLAKLRSLMADRFQLKVHKETKEMPVYALEVGKNAPKIAKKSDDFTPKSGLSVRRNAEGKTEVTGTDAPIMYLAYQLSQQVGRPVNDKTELKGNFDFKLTFAPDLADSDGPSIFTAVEEQLGLKLESQRGPVELLVIDSVEHPTSN